MESMLVVRPHEGELRMAGEPIVQADPQSEPMQGPEGDEFWNRHALTLSLGALLLLWVWKVYSTWGAWGNLTIDSGRELYVPGLLAQGKVLYRDVRYIYGPGAPYLNSYLFRLFGVHLDVLYWAGSVSVLGSAMFLCLTGFRLNSPLAGWSTGTVVLLESFHPTLFCFPLAYSFAAVYGCLVGCVFLWLAVRSATGKSWYWMLGAGSAAAAALLLKLEFGMACYGALFLLITFRAVSRRSWKGILRDLLAALPGVLVCSMVIGWMISIAGLQFLIQENMESWPSSYFMRTYGQMWLERNGFTLAWPALGLAALRAAPIVAVLAALDNRLWQRLKTMGIWLRSILAGVVTVQLAITGLNFSPPERFEQSVSMLFFPQDMVLYIAVAAAVVWSIALVQLVRRRDSNLAVPLLLGFSSLLAFRVLMRMHPYEYAIYYNGPVILSFLWLVCAGVPRLRAPRGIVRYGKVAVCLGCIAAAFLAARRLEAEAAGYVSLTTQYGTVRVTPALARNYPVAIRFMQEKAALGEAVLSLPEDTSLYVFSDTIAPIRTYAFTPGALPPGEPTDRAIREIEQKRVRYLLWSNRTFMEYGAPIFGLDFNRDFGEYLRAHYRRIGPLTPVTVMWEWNASVWERKPERVGN